MNIRDAILKDKVGWDEIKIDSSPVIKLPLDIKKQPKIEVIPKVLEVKPITENIYDQPLVKKQIDSPKKGIFFEMSDEKSEEKKQTIRKEIEKKVNVQEEIEFEKIKKCISIMSEKIKCQKEERDKINNIRREVRRELKEKILVERHQKLVDEFGEEIVKMWEEKNKKRREYYDAKKDRILELRKTGRKERKIPTPEIPICAKI